MYLPNSIRGILFDLDGVLYVGNQVIEGAIDTVSDIKKAGYSCRFITNTSTLSLSSLQQKMHRLGFAINENEIISATRATLIYLQQFTNPVCQLLLAEDVKKDFHAFKQSAVEADFVVIGDIGDQWSYPLLNQTFNLLVNGAQLIAIHKNRFWQTEHGLQMDIGGFIEALEYASQTQAIIMGKPSTDFFNAALMDMQLSAEHVAIIGDDIDSDIGGGQQAGLFGIQVKTGKYREQYAKKSAIKPNMTIDSIAELKEFII